MIYTLIRSRRKTVAIQITPAGEVLLRCPLRMSKKDAEAFLESKRGWIESHLARIPRPEPKLTAEELKSLARQASAGLPPRVEAAAKSMGISYGHITIRSQRTRWGSCSAKGNLNFNCLLMLCPEEVREYVVIHELCHRLELNHSPRFWALVARYCPDYARHRKWLKENGGSLIARLPE
jgi:predicted metal-dependent hydrolase